MGKAILMGNSGGVMKKVLWNNNNPMTAFKSQSVTLSDSIKNYDYIAFSYKQFYADNDTPVWQIVGLSHFTNTKDMQSKASFHLGGGVKPRDGDYDGYRIINCDRSRWNILSVGEVYFGNYRDTNFIIPLQIVGIKGKII